MPSPHSSASWLALVHPRVAQHGLPYPLLLGPVPISNSLLVQSSPILLASSYLNKTKIPGNILKHPALLSDLAEIVLTSWFSEWEIPRSPDSALGWG